MSTSPETPCILCAFGSNIEVIDYKNVRNGKLQIDGCEVQLS